MTTRRAACRDDRGAVTAEFAVGLTAVVIVMMLAIGLLNAAARQVRLHDAAADAARIVARGDPVERAIATVSRAAAGATTQVDETADVVCVTASATAMLALMITATSCALAGGR